MESLRQADEPPSEATTTPKASQPDSLSKAAEALTIGIYLCDASVTYRYPYLALQLLSLYLNTQFYRHS